MKRGYWAALWSELASRDVMAGEAGEVRMVERWRGVARRLDDGTDARPDDLLDFVLGRLTPDLTVLDIGAAVGRWTIPMAHRARSVTAVEPVEAMRTVFLERVSRHRLGNVTVVGEPWMDASVEPHDVVVATHSMYTSRDIVAFATKMEASARRVCYMALRIPAPDGIIGELSEQFTGEWHDSPNFVLAYNALLEAGIAANVFVEPAATRFWTDPSVDEALVRVRRHLRLPDSRFDDTIRAVLRDRLMPVDSGFRWPDCMRSGLLWWQPAGREYANFRL